MHQEITYYSLENGARAEVAYGGESVGIDLFNNGDDLFIDPISDFSEVSPRRTSPLIPTGLFIALPANTGAFIMERGSISKTPLLKRAGVIDPGYTGQIFVNLVNLSGSRYLISAGQKLPVQLVIQKTCDWNHFQQVSREEYQVMTSQALRQAGMTGSSDKG